MRIEGLELGLSADALAQLLKQAGKSDNPALTKPGAKVSRASHSEAALFGQLTAVGTAGADAAVSLSTAYLSPLSEIVKLLDIGQYKLAILRLLRRSDWIKLLYLLPKKLLINGLRLFSKEKLLKLIMYLPREWLIQMMLQIFSIEELVMKMPTFELMRILRSHKLDNRALIRGLQQMDPRFVQLLLYRIYGPNNAAAMKSYDLWRVFMHTTKTRMMEAMKTLSFKALIPFVTGFVKDDPQLLTLISDDFIFKLFDRLSKPTLIAACVVLPEDLLIKLLSQLPDKFLVQVAAQIDDKTFGEYLIANHANLLQSLAAA